MPHAHAVSEAHFTVGTPHCLQDNWAQARSVIERGLAVLRSTNIAYSDPERAETHFRAALTLAESRGMRPLAAHCQLALGKLYRRTGPRDQAEKHLSKAATMYRDMGMRFWLEQAEAARS